MGEGRRGGKGEGESERGREVRKKKKGKKKEKPTTDKTMKGEENAGERGRIKMIRGKNREK